MFENATTLRLRPGTLLPCLRFLRATVTPLLRRQPGLLSLALIPQPGGGITILTVWASRTCALAVEASPRYRQAMRGLDRFLAAPEPAAQAAPAALLRTGALSLN